MFLILILLGIVGFIASIIWYFGRQISYRNWLQTDDGILQIALEKLQRNPTDIDTLCISASLFFKKKNFAKAFEYYSRFIILTSTQMLGHISAEERFKIYREFGLSAYRVKKYDDAIISLQKARRAGPKVANLNLSATLGKLLYQKNHLREAVPELETAYRLDCEHEESHLYLGMCYARLSRFQEALPLLKEMRSKHAHNPHFMLALADSLSGTGEVEEGVKCYKSICEDKVMGAIASQNLAELYLNNNDKKNALKFLKLVPKREVPLSELSYKALYNSARIYLELDKIGEACKALEELCDLNSQYKDTMSLLRKCNEMKKNHNLYLLYYGKEEERKHIVRKLLQTAVAGICRIESESYKSSSIEIILKAVSGVGNGKEDTYYVWVSLADEVIKQEQLSDITILGKQLGCSRCLVVSANVFDERAKNFSEARSIDLIEGPEMCEKLLKIS